MNAMKKSGWKAKDDARHTEWLEGEESEGK